MASLSVATRDQVSQVLARQAGHLQELNRAVVQGAQRLQQREEELTLVKSDSALKEQQIEGLRQEVEALREKTRIAQEKLLEIAKISEHLSRAKKELAELEHENSLTTRIRANIPESLEDAASRVWGFIWGRERSALEVSPWIGEPLPWTEWQRRYQNTIQRLEMQLAEKLVEAGREGVPPRLIRRN